MTLVDNDAVLEMDRLIQAEPQRVFDAWLEREQFAAWIGPDGMKCDVPLLEPRVGGRYSITMRLTDGRIMPVAGVFKEIQPPRRLVFTWGWEGDAGRTSLITLTFAREGSGTRLTLRQEGLGNADNRDNHERGWARALGKLDRYLTTGSV